MRFRKRYVYGTLLTLWYVGAVSVPEAHAESLALTADWTYQSSSQQAGYLAESYTVDYAKRLDLTEVMSMDTNLRASHRTGADTTRQDVTPSLSYQINNDLFFFNLTGTDNEEFNDNSAQGDRSNRSLASTWNSNWSRQTAWWLPSVNLNATQNWQDDSLDPARQESESSSAGGNLNWDLALARVFYNYNTYDSNDAVSGNESNSENQLTRIETDASFLNGRGTMTLSQQFATTTNDYSTRVEGGIALLPVVITAYHGETSANPVVLSANSALTDGNRDATAITVNNPIHPMNIGVKSNNFQPVARIYLYTDIELLQSVERAFRWDLYTSNNNFDWTLTQASINGSYNPLDKRFEFIIPPSGREYVKLVAVNDPSLIAVNFTEVEAFQAVDATGSRLMSTDSQNTYQTNVGMSVALRPDLQLTSNVTYMKNTSTNGYDWNSTDISSGLSWNPNPDWSVQTNANRNLRERTNALSDENRSYGVSVNFPTVPTVDSVFGINLSEYYEENKKTNTGYNYTLQFIADLYRDLTGRFNCNFNQNDSLLTDLQSDTLSTTVGLTARLIPSLVADWTLTLSDTTNQSSTVNSNAMMTWRVTDNLSVHSDLYGSWGETNTMDLSAGFDMGLTDTMQISMTQRRQITPDTSNITALDWRWTITRYLSMMTSSAFLYGGKEEDEWTIASRLNTRFTTF
ncbi:MAG: hypothetical protein PHI06_08990 [Desulfobulbaceae bacterium]|nr:hypothetical protein [Desulfobulbaceae bacterium]